jgi:hypothetical protein
MKKSLAWAGIGIALVGLSACSTDSAPTGVAPRVRPPVMTGPGYALLNANPGAGTMSVCSAGASATFSVSTFTGNGTPQVGPLVGAGPYTLSVAAGACATIWVKPEPSSLPADPITSVTVTQTGQAAGWKFKEVEAVGNTGTAVNQGNKSATLAANAFHGASATFTQEQEEVLAPVCDRYTWGGHRKDLGYSYGGHAGLNTAGLAWGSFEFNNHITGDKYHVWNITAYGKPASGVLSGTELGRYASGMGLKNGTTPVSMEFRFIDNGEPGSKDQVWLAIDGQVVLSLQDITGGNVQLHDQCKKAPKAEKH